MRSFGVAVKEKSIKANTEFTAFEYALSSTGTHAAITQQWHAATNPSNNDLRVRIYIDGEETPSIDYPVGLAHAAGPNKAVIDSGNTTGIIAPFSAGTTFGRMNIGGYW